MKSLQSMFLALIATTALTDASYAASTQEVELCQYTLRNGKCIHPNLSAILSITGYQCVNDEQDLKVSVQLDKGSAQKPATYYGSPVIAKSLSIYQGENTENYHDAAGSKSILATRVYAGTQYVFPLADGNFQIIHKTYDHYGDYEIHGSFHAGNDQVVPLTCQATYTPSF